MRVSRRLFLHGSAAIVGGAGVTAITARRAEAQMAQSAVNYQEKPKGDQQCSNCKLFVAPNSCKIVAGPISPGGWCKLWVKA